MGSDDKKHDDDDVSQVAQAAQDVDDFDDEGYTMGEGPELRAGVMDAEEVYEDPQEEEYISGEDADDADGADGADGDDDFSDDNSAGKNSGKKKLFAPALVLVIALGIGASILMNSGGGSEVAPATQMPASVNMAQAPAVEPVAEIAAPVIPDDAMPPQPVALEQPSADGTLAQQQAAGRDGFGEQGDVPAGQADAAAVPLTADITEDLGTPPAAPPEMEIAGIPAADTAQMLPKTETPVAVPSDAAPVPTSAPVSETTPVSEPAVASVSVTPAAVPAAASESAPAPVVPAADPVVAAPAAEVPVVELPVADDSAMPKFPDTPVETPAAVTPDVPASDDEVPQVEEFPKIAADAAAPGEVEIPGMQGGGAEEGVVGKGAAETQEAPLTPMEEKPVVAKVPDADNYYDSKLTVPTNQAAKDTGPRKVDPTVEPGSRFVVVNKTHSGQSQESLMVSANRALKLGRYEAAIEMYDSLYSRNAKDPAILLGRAVAYQKAGRTDTALKIYDELLAVDKDNESALLNMLGLLREQYPEVALRRLMNLHEQYPGNAGISAQIGLTQADLGHYDDALRYLGLAASVEPKNALHLFNMGVVADRKGDKAQAIKFYEQALETDAVYGGGRSIQRELIYDRLSVLRRG